MAEDAQVATNKPTWTKIEVSQPDRATDRGQAWTCTQCEFIIGGPKLERPPSRCPMCAINAGFPIAVLPAEGARLSVLVLDPRFVELVEAYRTAKQDNRAQAAASDDIAISGNYDLDSSDFGPYGGAADASAAREQRSAIALADATLDRSSRRGQRSSREPPERDSRTSLA